MKALTLLFFFIYVVSLNGQCPDILRFDTQAEVDSFAARYPNCNYISGNIEIEDEVENLDGLSSITGIGGSLSIYRAHKLISLEGLNNLESANYITIRESEFISDISALSGLKQIQGFILEDSNIETFPVFSKLESIPERFWVLNNPKLNALLVPDTLEQFGEIWIRNNLSLQSISGFNNLKTCDELIISDNDNLISIDGFDALDSININGFGLAIESNSLLESIPSFNNLRKCSYLIITQNSSLRTLSAFNALEECSSFFILENGLESIVGFENLNQVTYDFVIRDESVLDQIPSFFSLTKTGYFQINNVGVSTLFGFNSLKEIESSLSIQNNQNLLNLVGFDNLEKTTGVSVRNNPLLDDCSAFCNYGLTPSSGEHPFNFYNNAPGCNSRIEVEEACNDTLGEIIVYDVVLNLSNGGHTLTHLENLTVEIFDENENSIQTLKSNEEGLVEVNLTKLDTNKLYSMVAVLDNPNSLKVIYNDISFKDFEDDILEIQFPNRLLDSIQSFQRNLDNRKITGEFLGGLPLNYSSDAYDLQGIENHTSLFKEISENHQEKLEEMKRIGLGLYMMNQYFDDAVRISTLTSKSIVETTYTLYKFIKELNSLKKIVEDFKEELDEESAKKAMDESMKAQMKIAYHFIKKFYINPYISSFEDNQTSKTYASILKSFLAVSEELIFMEGALQENLFKELVYNAGVLLFIEQYYIPTTTQNLAQIELNHTNIGNDFKVLVQNANSVRMQTESDNIIYEENAEFFSGYAEDIDAMAGYLEYLSVSISVYSGGTLTPITISMYEFAQGLKLGTLSLNGINTFTYGYRLIHTINELGQITNQFSEFPYNRTGTYDLELIQELISDLNLASEKISQNLNDWKTFIEAKEVIGASNEYLELSNVINSEFILALDRIISVVQNIGSELNADGNTNVEFRDIMEAYRQVEIQRSVLDIEFMAFMFDKEEETVASSLIDEITIYETLLEQFPGRLASFLEHHVDGNFPPLLTVSNYTYPDSLPSEPFKVTAVISNMGPLESNEFDIALKSNINCEVIIENLEELENLTLESGASIPVTFLVKPLNPHTQSGVLLTFNGERGVDESLVFNFFDQDLAFGEVPTFLDEISFTNKNFRIIPNPVEDNLNIHYEKGSNQIKLLNIYDIHGNLMISERSSFQNIKVQNLSSGIYFMELISNQGKSVDRFVKI